MTNGPETLKKLDLELFRAASRHATEAEAALVICRSLLVGLVHRFRR